MTRQPSNPTRRSLLRNGIGAAALLALPRTARALTTDEAARLVNQVVDEINGLINSGRSLAQKQAGFERIFSRYADVPIIARSVLGPTARSASSAQMRSFTEVFQGYIARKYSRRFDEFRGTEIQVHEASPYKRFYEVKSTAYTRGQSPVEVIFLVSDQSGSDRFFNIFIEGVNMLATERTEIGALLDQRRGDLDALIRDLRTMG